jgi:hypothetical protein
MRRWEKEGKLILCENPVIDAHGKITYVLRDGHHVTLTLPERNRDKHVWCLWSKINTKLKQPRVRVIGA